MAEKFRVIEKIQFFRKNLFCFLFIPYSESDRKDIPIRADYTSLKISKNVQYNSSLLSLAGVYPDCALRIISV